MTKRIIILLTTLTMWSSCDTKSPTTKDTPTVPAKEDQTHKIVNDSLCLNTEDTTQYIVRLDTIGEYSTTHNKLTKDTLKWTFVRDNIYLLPCGHLGFIDQKTDTLLMEIDQKVVDLYGIKNL